MTPKDRKDVQKIVEKYRCEFPNLNRRILARLIRAEQEIENNSADGRKLNRYLKKSFDAVKRLREDITEANVKLSNLKDKYINKTDEIEKLTEKLKFADTYLKIIKLLETEEDFQLLKDFFEKIRKKKAAKASEEEQRERAEILRKETRINANKGKLFA